MLKWLKKNQQKRHCGRNQTLETIIFHLPTTPGTLFKHLFLLSNPQKGTQCINDHSKCCPPPPQRSSGGLILNCDINKQTNKKKKYLAGECKHIMRAQIQIVSKTGRGLERIAVLMKSLSGERGDPALQSKRFEPSTNKSVCLDSVQISAAGRRQTGRELLLLLLQPAWKSLRPTRLHRMTCLHRPHKDTATAPAPS